MPDERSDYDRVWDVLKNAIDEMKEAEIPDHEVPPAVADFLIMSVLAMGRSSGSSVTAARAIIERMEEKLEDYIKGEPPFCDADADAIDEGEDAHDKHGFSSLRFAMECMVDSGGMELDQAAACVGIFAMGLVNKHEGPERVQALLNTWTDEFERMRADGDGGE